jgi:hypothetical protein
VLAHLFAGVGPAPAAVTTLHYYRMGSADPDAAADQPAGSQTMDSIGTAHLSRFGDPVYVTSGVTGDTLGIDFTNRYGGVYGTALQYYQNATAVIRPDDDANWGIEAWVYFDAFPEPGSGQSEAMVFHVGDLNAGSLILQTVGEGAPRWAAHAPGLVLVAGTSEVRTGAWTHVAVVCNDGNLQLYVDGNLEGESEVGLLPPRGGITVGAGYYNGVAARRYARGMDGKVAEARIFMFDAGQFDPQADLLFPRLP